MLGKRKTPELPAGHKALVAAVGDAVNAAAQAAADEPRVYWRRTRRTVRMFRNVTHRDRHQLRPWLLLTALALAGLAGHVLPAGPVLAPAAGAGWAATRLHRAVRKDAARPRYAALCIIAAVVWLGWAAAAGPHSLAAPALVLGWVALSVGWWGHHLRWTRWGSAQVAAVFNLPAAVMLAWEQNVIAHHHAAAGTVIGNPQRIPGGHTFDIELIPGKQIPETLIGLRPQVSSGLAPLGISRQQVFMEAGLGTTPDEPGLDHRVRLLVLDRKNNVVNTIQEFTGPTLNVPTGLFTSGPYPDGTTAYGRLYKVDEHGRPMRSASGLWVGDQGSGKSRGVEHKILEHMLSGFSLVWFLDGMGGNSMPHLLDGVDDFGLTLYHWRRILRNALKLRSIRTRRQAANRLGCFYATHDDPFVQIIIDEAHKVLADPVCARAVKALLQEGEKVGIGVDLVTQVPLQAELGDQSGTGTGHVIRALVKNGNIAVFKTGSSWTGQVTVGHWSVNPEMLPQDPPGMHYLYAAGANSRQLFVRKIRVADPAGWAADALTLAVHLHQLDVHFIDGTDGDYSRRGQFKAEQLRKPDTENLSHADLAEEIAAVTGEAGPAALQAAKDAPAGAVPVTAQGACMALISEGGPVKRADIPKRLSEKGLDYSKSSLDQALRVLAEAGVLQSNAGVWSQRSGPALVPDIAGEVPAGEAVDTPVA